VLRGDAVNAKKKLFRKKGNAWKKAKRSTCHFERLKRNG